MEPVDTGVDPAMTLLYRSASTKERLTQKLKVN
jgi:hypothetical protein